MKQNVDIDVELARLQRVADVLDAAISVPGTPVRIGIDGLIGFIPGIGDSITLPVALWIVYRASQLGARKGILVRMLANVGIDYVFGLVPLIGDIFDIAWKANRRNVNLLRAHFGR